MVVVRGINFAATAITAGVLIFVAVVANPAFVVADAVHAGKVFLARSRAIAWASLAITVISGVAWIVLQASAMSGVPLDQAVTSDVLWIVVSKTHFGLVSDLRPVLAGILAASLSPAGSARWTRWLPPIFAAGLAATIAWTGHAAATPGSMGTFHLAGDALHVLASSASIGGLLPLAMLLAMAAHDDGPAWTIAREATLRFSTLGIVSVSTLLATSAVNAWILVGSLSAFVQTDYGLLVLVKIALFSLMVSLATVNRLQFDTPALSAVPGYDAERGITSIDP